MAHILYINVDMLLLIFIAEPPLKVLCSIVTVPIATYVLNLPRLVQENVFPFNLRHVELFFLMDKEVVSVSILPRKKMSFFSQIKSFEL